MDNAQYTDAEPLLLAAHKGFLTRNESYPTPSDSGQLRTACAQLVQLYEKSNQPEKAATWQKKLGELTEESKDNDREN